MSKRRKNRASRKKRQSRKVAGERSTRSALSSLPNPPRLAEQILHFMLPRDQREAKIGDLSEHYKKLSRKFNRRWLNAWYYKETIIVLLGQVLNIVRLIIYGIEEIIRRHFS